MGQKMMSCKTKEYEKVEGPIGKAVPKFESKKFDKQFFDANKDICFEGSNFGETFKP